MKILIIGIVFFTLMGCSSNHKIMITNKCYLITNEKFKKVNILDDGDIVRKYISKSGGYIYTTTNNHTVFKALKWYKNDFNKIDSINTEISFNDSIILEGKTEKYWKQVITRSENYNLPSFGYDNVSLNRKMEFEKYLDSFNCSK